MRRSVRLMAWATALLGLGLFLSVALPPMFGWETLVVAGSSMAPSLRQGSVIVIAGVNPQEIGPGDVITYQRDGRLTTHRVVLQGPGALVTRGDGNPAPDPTPVPPGEVRGRLIYQVPWVGYGFRHLGAAMTVLLLLPALVLASGRLVRALSRMA